ncbi:hypothetical protein PVM12_16755 [Enterobacter soli]|uniref:hypothetical protein n=1 Tax=Enterobacter soli TaxID=885040 RepID=UPI0023781889|nr:hypothetical protein [Enterobacter soli]MDD9245680.1 hypothetical protein [Enterobacter soli]
MSTITREFTKEQLIARINQVTAINKYRISRDPDADGLAMDNELLAIALASLEADSGEYLTHVVDDGYGEFSDRMNFSLPVGTKLYTATSAPVSVPTFEEWCESTEQKPVGWVRDAMKEAYDGCRAAMLQGAEPVSNCDELPDDWVACSEWMPREVLAALQNVARLRRSLNDFCGDKSVIARCLSEAEGALLNAVNRHSTMLAAPQQEVKVKPKK